MAVKNRIQRYEAAFAMRGRTGGEQREIIIEACRIRTVSQSFRI